MRKATEGIDVGKRVPREGAVLSHWLPPLTAAQSSPSLRQDPKRKNSAAALGTGSHILSPVPASSANLLHPLLSLPPSSPDQALLLPSASYGISLPPLLCSEAVGKGREAWPQGGEGNFLRPQKRIQNETFYVTFQSEKELGE